MRSFFVYVFCALLLCTQALCPALAAAPENAPTEAAPAPEEDVWTLIFQNRLQDLNKLYTEVDSLNKEIPAQVNALRGAVTQLKTEHQRLGAIMQLSQNMPMELGAVLERLEHLYETSLTAALPVQELLDSAKDKLERINSLDIKASDPAIKNLATPESAQYLNRVNQSRDQLTQIVARLGNALSPATTLSGLIQQDINTITAKLPTLWKNYYVSASSSLFDLGRWKQAVQSLGSFDEALKLRLSAQMPNTAGDIVYSVFRALVTLLFLTGATLFASRLVRTSPLLFQQGWRRVCANSLRWIYTGIALYVASVSPRGDLFYVLTVSATYILSIGQLALAWDLRSFDDHTLPGLSPLYKMLVPLFGGLLALFFNLPPTPLSALWAFILLACLWWHHKQPDNPDIPALEQALLKGHHAYLWLLLAMALFGWGRLSILMCMGYAALAVLIQFIAGIVKLSNQISQILPQDGFKGLVGGAAMALAVPILLLLCTLGAALWFLAYPGGTYMVMHVAKMDINLGETSLNLAQMLLFISAFYITRSAVSVGQTFLRQLPQHASRMDPSLIGPMQTVYTYTLWLAFLLFILSSMGFGLTNLLVVAGGLSVGVGLGLQSIVNNFISGLLVIFGRNLQEGDIVEIGPLSGVVKRVDIRSTTLETFDNATIFVPNASLISSNLINWTRNGRSVRRDVTVGVGYESNVEQVRNLLLDIAQTHPSILSQPLPAVIFDRFGASTLDFTLRFWVPDISLGVSTQSELRAIIHKNFAEAGISIAYPQLDVHLHTGESAPETPSNNHTAGENACKNA